MKVVINTCYGGFGLSQAAVKKLAMAGSCIIQVDDEKEWLRDGKRGMGHETYTDIGDGFEAGNFLENVLWKGGKVYHYDRSFDAESRANPELVAIVEEMGEDSFGQYSNLKVVEVPDGIGFEIEEYDGREWVSEKHRTWN